MTSGPRQIVVDEPEYTASVHEETFEDGRVMTFAHIEVFFLSPSIMRQLHRQFELFREHVNVTLFCMGDVDDDKFSRFVSRFGFEYLGDIPCTDDKTRRLFVSFADQTNGPTKEAQEQ